MSVFNPTLETEIRYEQPVQAPRQFSPVAALADTATQALKIFDASRPTQASIASAQLAEFGDEINRAIDLKEQGKPFKSNLNKAAVKLVTSGIKDVPAELKSLYSGVSGVDFDAIGYQDEGEYQKSQILSSEKATALAASVRAQNPNFTSEEVDSEVLQSLTQTAFLEQQVALQNARAAAGLDVKTTPIVESIQNDFDILAGKVAEFQADGIVTREEYLSATTSVRSLISAKYSNFNNNPEVKSIQDQMFGMLDDIGKGVSTDPLDVQLDTIQVALTRSDFSPATIATIRSLIKTNPDSFRQILEKQLGERGDSFVDALDKIWSAPSEELKLEDIFGTNTPPPIASSAGENPSLMEIPNVADNPEEYQKVVEGLGTLTSTTKPVNIINSEETRNAWLNSMNVVSSLVASQSDEYIMGDKLLSVFSSNGVVANLDSVYRTDPMNAAQTNDGLQKALISERTRQNNELNQRLGRDDSYFRVDGDRLVLNVDFLRSKMGNVPQGDRRIAAIEAANARIEQVGGLESFLKLPQNRRNEILEGSNLERILDTRFGQTIKLFNNLKLIDKKLGSLVQLEKKYSSATDLFRGSDELDAFARQALQDVMNDDRIFSQTLDSLGPDQPQASEATSISDAAPMAAMRAIPPSTESSPPSPLGGVEVPSQEMPLVLPAEEVPFKKIEGVAPTRDLLIDSVFSAEGGYSTDKTDQGNYINGKFIGTNHGISAPILADYLGREPTVEEMKNLTKDKAREIAANRYYDRFKIGTLPSDVQEIVFHGVYMSESRAVRAMQNLLGLTPDGILGPNTEKAIQEATFSKEDFKDAFLQELEFGTSKINPRTNEPYSQPSPTWGSHGKGWTNRYTELTK